MRKLTYYVACSVDRFIGHKNGSTEGFLTEGEHFADLFTSFPETVPSHLRDVLGVHDKNQVFDTVLMGRKTYEVGLPIGLTNPYSTLKQYVFSRLLKKSPDENVEVVADDPLSFVHTLKQGEGQDIWLCGGAELASVLFHELDDIILKVNPFLMGSGIPLFADDVAQTNLTLVDSKVYPNGFMRLHYQLKH